jgi:23S rRNA (adenine2030-N6)-methyltransferase
MNYRHAFHAGNFADVHKHVVLTRILMHLRNKPAAFRVIDTHAGAGRYDLSGDEAGRSGEWRDGIGRVRAASLEAHAQALLAPYLDIVAAYNPSGPLAIYPGSPLIARGLMRPQDRLIACELEPHAAAALAATLRGGRQAKAVTVDGWTALSAYVPPKERRGLVLIDPPFEEAGEFARLADALAAAHRKWPTGIYALWYPLKERAAPDTLAKRLRALGLPKLLRSELMVGALDADAPLAGSGIIVANPPFPLAAELRQLLPALARALSPRGACRIEWLAGERPRGTFPQP